MFNVKLTLLRFKQMMWGVKDHNDDVPTVFRPVDPDQARAQREQLALVRIAERHLGAHTAAGDAPGRVKEPLSACAAVRLVSSLASIAVQGPGGRDRVDAADLLSALTLLPRARAELDQMEAGLLFLARAHGMTWSEIAYGLGLRSPQAAQQRSERTLSRADERAVGTRRKGAQG